MKVDKVIIMGAIIIILVFIIILMSLYSNQKNSQQNSIHPVFGKYLSFQNGSTSKIYLVNSSARYDTFEKNMIDHITNNSVKKGDPCVIVTATIRSEYDKTNWLVTKVQLYNNSGNEVGIVTMLDAPWKPFETVRVESNITRSFDIYIKYDKKDIERYDIFLDYKLLDGPLP
jgi:hypothetical protein